jgi:hypothetical protein
LNKRFYLIRHANKQFGRVNNNNEDDEEEEEEEEILLDDEDYEEESNDVVEIQDQNLNFKRIGASSK